MTAHIQVFNHHIQLPYLLLAVLEFALLMAAAYFSVVYNLVGFKYELFVFHVEAQQYALLYASVMLLATFSMGVHGAGLSDGFISMFVRTVVSYCLLGLAIMIVLSFVVPVSGVARGSLFMTVCSSLVLVMLLRWAFYSLVDMALLKRRILVLGAGVRAAKIIERIKAEPLQGSTIVGYVPTDSEPVGISSHLLLDPVGGIKHLVKKHHVDEILIAIDERRRDRGSFFPLEELLDCKLSGTRITEVVEFYEREFSRIELSEINTSWMILSDQFRYSQLRDKSKRLFDITVSLLLLSVMWPFMVLTALAIFLESGAPVLYSQQRVGYKGRVFPIYKFRSMRQDAEKDGKAVWAQQNDSRVTKVGAFIRNTRLDELPQIFNVLRGEMSFVGPRPERPEFVKDLSKQLPYYDARHRVKPGLMGWAQLKYSYGASVDDAANKLVYDLYYVKNHSSLLDLLIVVQSVEVVLLGKGVR
ncbi:TIGR03013 family XrtA/PEP-CTERM system glycosyltransferase [Oceanicoccus sp. KOV_DT_Chl]|uniref:TIGR03013 family XrtA/PEP-CTERM system glycosyltransferase n=1 Tax=Oceanicoccus sp. KOV_DT_Chl TaxID=1904639 RepID=UPI001F1C4649|nr:TIGR03013 family XrtA/PEP-CTERM system glycosyltransferase [Oceanicoccus sp. KOV_DT_Chl]